MEIVFGIPLKIKRKITKYPNIAVLTVEKAPTEKGASFRFILNKKAVELLTKNLPAGDSSRELLKVSFSFDEEKIFIVDSTNLSLPRKDYYNVTRNHVFSNRKVYEYIINLLKLDRTVEHEFKLEKIVEEEISGRSILLELTHIIPETENISSL